MRNCCKEYLNFMNSPECAETFVLMPFDDAIERKAFRVFSKNIDIKPMEDELSLIGNDDPEKTVTVQALFRSEIEITISLYPALLDRWRDHRVDNIDKIVDIAFKKFNTIRNAETCKFDIMSAQIIVSECVRMYFEELWLN